ncbi:RecB-like exonuclease [Mycobacterium phage HokkenD]|nr:RecB-like exonuclease [Mycobacterium phage HokkenD]
MRKPQGFFITAKITFSGTIPCQQYGNVVPTFEITADTHEDAVELGLQKLQDIWNRVGTKPLDIDRGQPQQVPAKPTGVIKKCRVSGAEVIFDPVAHTYHDKQGRKYRGGSSFAAEYKSPFEADIISGKMAAKHGVPQEDILAMWKLNSEASTTFGTSLHAALELYGRYLELSKILKDGTDESCLTKNPVLRPIVQKFFTEERIAEKAYYEEFVADPDTLSCGLIDRLVVDDDGLWVEDYKSNASVTDKKETYLAPFKDLVEPNALGGYVIQLSYYAAILKKYGRNVKGLRIHHWDGEGWTTYEREMIDISGELKSIKEN